MLGKFGNLVIHFIIDLILARLLVPEDYGVLGVLLIFFSIATTFVDAGFTSALVRKQGLEDIDKSTAFYFNMVIGILMYAIMFLGAPWLATFFRLPILVSVTRVAGLNILFGAFMAVQQALYRKKVDFKTISLVSLAATSLSGLVGVGMAYAGFGVWALVFQQLTVSGVTALLLWIFSEWKPRLEFSWRSFHEMFAYGIKLLGAQLLGIVYFHGEKVAIGKLYSADELGLYSKGTNVASLGSSSLTTVLMTVTFPILSTLQDDDDRLIAVYRKYIRLSSELIFFVMILLAALARPVMLVLYTAKWAKAVIFLQMLSFSLMFDHISSLNLNIFYVKGRSDIVLRLEVVKRVISIAILVASIPFGIISICLSRVLYTQLALVINAYYTGKMFHYGYFQQWKDYSVYFLMGILSATPGFLLTWTTLPNLATIAVGGLVACVIYVGLLKWRKDEIFEEFVMKALQKYVHRIMGKRS